jgi:glutathione S-transferase
MEFVDVETAKNSPGLRGAFVCGAPSPWGEAAKGLLHIKQIPCVGTRYLPGGDNTALIEWTGVDSGPAIVYENEPARSGWAEILLLAEHLAPEPRLIPEDPAQRALLFGLAHELCGELGFGWSIRLVMVDRALDPNVEFPMDAGAAQYLGSKYGYRPGIGPQVRKRTIEVLGLLSERLQAQKATGSQFLLGDSLTALDVYWATFAALVAPLPPDKCPMVEGLRKAFEAVDPEITSVLDPALVEHRDFIYNEYLVLPMEL